MKYGVYSGFSIKQHKQTFIHYLEVIIDENGKIMYAVPSHQEKMIKLACEKLNVTREKLNENCPQEYYCDFMTWLSKVGGACAVWEKFDGEKCPRCRSTNTSYNEYHRDWVCHSCGKYFG